MKKVWIAADSVISPLGLTADHNYKKIMAGVSSLSIDTSLGKSQICLSRFAPHDELLLSRKTRFESIAVKAIEELRSKASWPAKKTLFILSTTKGNIELLENEQENPALLLAETAKTLAAEARVEDHLVVSNACTSGVAALLVARRFLLAGSYDHAIILGADVSNGFIISGFQSLMALSPEPCRPFDAARTGINLGEVAAAIFLTTEPKSFHLDNPVAILGGGMSNDANHISGPSKTGSELAMAVNNAMKEAGTVTGDVGFISAHGTGTLYNDEMEAKAFNLAGLMHVPLHSLKGYVGHTLGGAGIIETVMSARSLQQQELIPSLGFVNSGVSMPLNVCTKREQKQMTVALKTASGFGGTNAAMVIGL